MEIKYTFEGFHELKNRIGKIDAKKAINLGIKQAIIFLQGEAIKNTPVDTGLLRNAYRIKFGSLYGELRNTKPYGIFVHEGTKAHIISAKNKKALFWNGARHPISKVMHPGYKGNPWMKRTLDDNIDTVTKIINTSVSIAVHYGKNK